MPVEVMMGLVLVGSSFLVALLALLVLSTFLTRAEGRPSALFASDERDPVFLFDDETLIDASDSARAILAASPVQAPPWTQLVAYLDQRFDGFAAQIATLAERGSLNMAGTDPAGTGEPWVLRAEWRNGLARITVLDPEAEGRSVTVDHLSHRATEQELSALRATVEKAPLLVWRQTPDNAVVWANGAYLMLAGARQDGGEPMTWPLPQLFETPPAADTAGTATKRLKLTLPGDKKPRWFDAHSFDEGRTRLRFAVPADATVQAETALREFVQTLTKTFAHLSIGLAIFDRQRQLALFNPALMDLTGIGPEVLSARPTLFAFLDRLREDRRMPEPKDYKTWRQQMAALEKAASSGQYEEIWTLPSGQTYRVVGRPHPDGAVALLFEDISAEISLTRRFRAELEMGQSALNAMPEAVAVFSSAGLLVMSNSAYADLWGVDPLATLGEMGIQDALRHWQALGLPAPVWSGARDFVANVANRSAWAGPALLADGRRLRCRFAILSGGNALIGFAVAPEPADPAVLPGQILLALPPADAGREHETA